MRQVHFSTKTPDQSIDVVAFLNGLPIISIELKNHFTGQWGAQQGVTQYRNRDYREQFWGRCLVHFALDDDSVYTTALMKRIYDVVLFDFLVCKHIALHPANTYNLGIANTNL